MTDNMRFLLWGAPVPDSPEFRLPGFSRAGNLAQMGIADGLYSCCGKRLEVLGFQTIQTWPRYKSWWICGQDMVFDNGLRVRLLPSINILGFREIFRGLLAFFFTLLWCLKSRKEHRIVLTYNLYTPPFPFVYWAAWLCGTPVVPILFDIGMPPGSLGGLRDWIYRYSEKIAKKYIPKAQGVCAIVDKIRDIYCPKRHALRVDGGISPDILLRLFELRRNRPNDKVRFVMAGSIAPHNGIDLLLAALELLPRELSIEIDIAGTGSRSEKLMAIASKDKRLRLHGLLDLDSLFALYQKADVILNLRITKELDTCTWFPSKFFEALVCGRCVLTTNVAHIQEEYGKYCVVINDETPGALACAMKRIVDMGCVKRDKMGCSAREYMLSAHTWGIQTRRMVDYCKKIVQSKLDNYIGMVQIY